MYNDSVLYVKNLNYKQLSFIQSIFILLPGITLFDQGLKNISEDPEFKGFIIHFLFETITLPFWNSTFFYAYCFIIVAVIQFYKAFTIKFEVRL